jgi:hypothetical protein
MYAAELQPAERQLLDELVAFQHDHRGEAHASLASSRPWRGARRAMVAGAALLVAAGAVLYAARPDGSSRDHPAGVSIATISAATLNARSAAAVSDKSDSVLTMTSPGAVSTIDLLSQTDVETRVDANGSPTRVFAVRRVAGSPDVHDVLIIDYGSRSWNLRRVASTPQDHAPPIPDPAEALQQQLSDDIAVGRSVVEGSESVDGSKTWRVRTTLPDGTTSTIWIDQETSLPVKQVSPVGSVTYTYNWQARTPDVLASLWPTPPAGFTEVSDPRLVLGGPTKAEICAVIPTCS